MPLLNRHSPRETERGMRNGTMSLARLIVVTRCRERFPSAAAPTLRWSSTATRKTWSTPLAKTIAEAIEVGHRRLRRSRRSSAQLIELQGHGTDLHCCVYAPMPHLPSGRILHDYSREVRPVRPERRLHHLARDLAGLRRAGGSMVRHGVDGPGEEEQRRTVDRGWAW